ncbi:MAG: hypothetical protein H7Y07_15235 [Pyrinomonadaceae bacterium]|nr:hypothetical protein [Sphingobacteriaceae bacterium]
MKKLNFCLIAIVAIATLSINGCKKEPKTPLENSTPVEKVFLPVKMSTDTDNEILKFKYLDNTGMIKEIEGTYTLNGNTENNRIVISYNATNQPVKLEGFSNGELEKRTVYTLNTAGDVIRGDHTWMYNGQMIDDGNTELSYNASRQLTSVKYITITGNTYEEKFEYNVAGNIAKYIFVNQTFNLEYDFNNGAFKGVKNFHLIYIDEGGLEFFLTQNNLIKLVNPADASNNESYTYEYNTDKYPVKINASYGSSTRPSEIITFEYSVK